MGPVLLLLTAVGLILRSADPQVTAQSGDAEGRSWNVVGPGNATPLAPRPARASCAAPERRTVYEALEELFTCLVETHIEASDPHLLAGRLNFGRLAGSGAIQAPLLTRHFTTGALMSRYESHRRYFEIAPLFPPEWTPANRNEAFETLRATKIEAYLTYLTSSPYIVDTYATLKSNDALPEDCSSLRDFVRVVLYNHWFKPYGRQAKLHRRGVKESSGFGHVFVGEISTRGVTGFHNWLAMLAGEESGTFKYKGYMKVVTQPLVMASLQFDWLGREKPISSFAFGVDTDFQLALFSACFVVKPGRKTRLRIKELPVAVQTFVVEHQPESVGTAYFVF